MKRTATLALILIAAFSFPHFGFSQWVPLRVNTNTWECKPSGTWGTNYWNDIASGTALGVVSNQIGSGSTSPSSPTSTPPVSATSPYFSAALWLDFVTDNGTGTNVTDGSGNGIDFYETSGLTIDWNQPQWVDYGMETTLIGQNGFKYDGAFLNSAAEYTVAMWVRTTSTLPTDYNFFTVGGTAYSLRLGNISTSFGFADGVSTYVTCDAPTVGEWVHYVCTRRADDSVTLWTNSVQAATTSATLAYPTGVTSWRIGGVQSPSFQYFDAQFDDVAAWPRILTGSEITNMYNNGRSTNATWYSNSTW